MSGSLLDRIGLRGKSEIKEKPRPDHLVYGALDLWNVIAPERMPEPGADIAYFVFTSKALGQSSGIEALDSILSVYTKANGQDRFGARLGINPKFHQLPVKERLRGEPSFYLDIWPGSPNQFPHDRTSSFIRILELTDSPELVNREFDSNGLVEYRTFPSFYQIHRIVITGEGPEPFTGKLCWNLVGFDESENSPTWKNSADFEFFMDQLNPERSQYMPWQKQFGKSTIQALTNYAKSVEIEKWMEFDRRMKKNQANPN